MKKYKLQISYVILLTLCLPLSALYFTLFGETAAVAENADSASHLLSAYIPLGCILDRCNGFGNFQYDSVISQF